MLDIVQGPLNKMIKPDTKSHDTLYFRGIRVEFGRQIINKNNNDNI